MNEIAQGYKQTKIGIIPEEWKEFKLKDILNLKLEPLKMEDEKDYELVTVRRKFGGVDSRGILKGKSILVKNQYYVRKNDFIISKRQISHGACGLVPDSLDGAIVSNEYNVFKPNKDLLNLIFFNYYVRVPKFSQTFYNYSNGVHIEKLLFKTESWLKQKIPFPSLKEQEKIADILRTWDNTISMQSQLIKDKEELRKGLMQRLLTGKVRFSEFSDDWKEVNLKDIASTSIGLVTTMTTSYAEIGIPLIRNSDIKPNKIRKEKLIYLNHDFSTKHENRKLMLNDIVTVHTGEIGVSAIIDESLNGCHGFATLNTRIFDSNVLPEYICWYFNSEKNINFAFSMATGDGRSNFNLKDFNRTKIPLPSLQEQQKIAEVLSNADKEIDLFKNELEELKEQKKGLMQKLLTGKVRVKI